MDIEGEREGWLGVPYVTDFLLFSLAFFGVFTADVQMAGFLGAAFDAHEFVEF